MTIRFEEIGQRLKAFRFGSGLSAEEVAKKIGVSRTALYRIEKGELTKIETFAKLSELLNVSMPTLFGVGIEYIPSAVSYFERTRQLEETAEHLVVLAGPISFLLASDQFEAHLESVLSESISEHVPDRKRSLADVQKIMGILHQRKQTYRRNRPSIVNLISTWQIERFLNNGLVAHKPLSPEVLVERQWMARQELEHLVSVIEEQSMGVQIGLVSDNLPLGGFQIFRQADRSTLTLSPFRLGEQPNIRVGVAMATSAPEALKLHQQLVNEAWRTAMKGQVASQYLKDLLKRTPTPSPLASSVPSALSSPLSSPLSSASPNPIPAPSKSTIKSSSQSSSKSSSAKPTATSKTRIARTSSSVVKTQLRRKIKPTLAKGLER